MSKAIWGGVLQVKRRRVSRDALGRRTDKVKRQERNRMERLKLGDKLANAEIARRLGRDPRTVHKQLELAEQREENSAKAAVEDTARQHELIQKWRIEVESYSPCQLLQRWLDEASEDALSDFFKNKDAKMLYLEAQRPHLEPFDAKRLYLRVETDPVFRLLHQKFPTSTVWSTLEAWGEQAVPYLRTFSFLVVDMETLMDLGFSEEGIDDSNLSVFTMRRRMERAYGVLLACDLLTSGIAHLPSNVRWALLASDIEKLRGRVNVHLSSLTKRTRKGGWSTANLIKEIWADAEDHSGLAQVSKRFLTELVKLQAIQDQLAIALQELESEI